MSNEAILRKVLEKAHANGYKPLMTVEGIIAHNNQYKNPIAIIFTHDFAKAFWGEAIHGKAGLAGDGLPGWKCENCGGNLDNRGQKEWQYHLQQMVGAEEPLKYLERFL